MYEWVIGPVLKAVAELQGEPRETSEPSGGEPDAVVMFARIARRHAVNARTMKELPMDGARTPRRASATNDQYGRR